MEAAVHMAARNISVEVVDLRSLVPLDWETLTASARKTGRVIVCDHGYLTCGFAPTIAAGIQERAFDALKGPVLSLASADVPMPYSFTLANEIVPTTARLISTIERCLQSHTNAAFDHRHQYLAR
jgi:pyruvate dehydrogenase E1 component beta subunit